MTEQEALARMIAPGTRRRGKYREGVIQVHVTRACDKSCFHCTQGSNLGGKLSFISLENFEIAVKSLVGYFGVVGVFGGNPALHPKFPDLCAILAKYIPFNQRGLWCNHPKGHGRIMRETFDPSISNLNVHLDQQAYHEFKRDWPESNVVGVATDSRHSPCYVAMKDVLKKPCPTCMGLGYIYEEVGVQTPNMDCPTCNGTKRVYDESRAWELISNCDINKHWSAMIGEFRGQPRAWFCEIAGAQAMLHQHDPSYPDAGYNLKQFQAWAEPGETVVDMDNKWWRAPMWVFTDQVRKHCHECSVPLRGHGELAMHGESGTEQVSKTHADIYKLKRVGRRLELVTLEAQLGPRLAKTTDYLGNSKR